MNTIRAPLSEVFRNTDALQLIDSQVFGAAQLTEVVRQAELLLKKYPMLDDYYCNFRNRPDFQNLKLLAEYLGKTYVFTPLNPVGTTKMLIETQAFPNGTPLETVNIRQ